MRDAGALATRLVAWLALTAAALFGVVAFGISRLERAPADAASRYLLPGGRATLDARIVVLFAVLAGGAALIGAALLALSPSPALTAPLRRRGSRRGRSLAILVAGLLALAAAFLIRRGGL